ncbi:hypothetical protein CV014_13825 [Nostoc sp. CMAA1605]|nr:hypothetical protein [Nostoc sp. CMAA1605]
MKQWGGRYLSKLEAFPPSHHHLQTLPLQLKLKLYRLLAFLTRNQFTKILQHIQNSKTFANCELRIANCELVSTLYMAVVKARIINLEQGLHISS